MEKSNGLENLLDDNQPEPRWQALVAAVAVGGLYTALPESLIVGPRWLFLSVVVALLVPTVLSHIARRNRINRILGLTVNAVITVAMIASVALLIGALPAHKETPVQLLLSAAALWITNILVFALWYWRLDAGGPHGREIVAGHQEGAFLFPQMTLPANSDTASNKSPWSPNFVDYLFLAFNTSTAFSPTDVPVLERWAKLLMMLQSLISLTVLVLLAARGVNIL